MHPGWHELKPFLSPDSEVSVFKGIPNTDYWHSKFFHFWKNEMQFRSDVVKYWKRYRGPRIHGNQYDCKKEDAYSFSVYVRPCEIDTRCWSKGRHCRGVELDVVKILIKEIEPHLMFDQLNKHTLNQTHGYGDVFRSWLVEELPRIPYMERLKQFPNYHFYGKYSEKITNYLNSKYVNPDYYKRLVYSYIVYCT